MRRFSELWIKIIFYLLYGFIIISVFLSLTVQDNKIGMLESVEPLTFYGTASIDGRPPQVITDSLWQNGITHSLVVHGQFSDSIKGGNSLILWPRNLRVRLYVNDNLMIVTGQRESFPDFIAYAGNSYQIFNIGEISDNDLIRMEIEKAYDSCRINVITEFFHNIYTGREGAVYQSIITNEMLQPLIGIALILFGVIVLAAGIFQKFGQLKNMRQIHFFGSFCLIGGLSYICDSSYMFIDLLFPHPVFNTLVDLCCIPLLLFFYLMYISSVIRSKKSKNFMKWITAIFIALQSIPFMLQITGIQDLHVVQDQNIFMGGFIIFFGFCTIIYETRNHSNEEAKKAFSSTLPLMICLFLKIGNIVLDRGVERSYLRIGILISFLMLLHNTFKTVRRSMELIEKEQLMKQELQNAQVAVMLSQIHPHFLYNALNTLQHICLKDGELAAEAIGHFSRYLRGNMESLTADRPIPFEKELDHVKHYLYIQKLRFGDRIQIKYDLKITDFTLPTLTLQPIVENAVRHGITKQAEGGLITITTRQDKNEVLLIITDNGAGFDTTLPLHDNQRHIGISNVRKRLELQCGGTIDIISNKQSGTKVIIRLKGNK